MKHTKANIVACGFQRFDEKDEILTRKYDYIHYNRLSSKSFFNSYYTRNCITGKLIRRKYIGEHWFISNTEPCEDTLFNLTLVSFIENPIIFETSEPMYYYCQRNNSILRTTQYENQIRISEWLVKNPDKIGTECWSWMVVLKAIKMALSYRYGAMVHQKAFQVRYANEILRNLIIKMLKNRHSPMKEKIIHVIMMLLPGVYRLFRIMDDPSLKNWEHNIKKRY